jgi:hypothetical protein
MHIRIQESECPTSLAIDALTNDLAYTQEEPEPTQSQLPILGAFVKGDPIGSAGETYLVNL